MRQIKRNENGNIHYVVSNDPYQLIARFLTLATTDPQLMPFQIESMLQNNSMGLYLVQDMGVYQVEEEQDIPPELNANIQQWLSEEDCWLLYRDGTKAIPERMLLILGTELRFLFKEAYRLSLGS